MSPRIVYSTDPEPASLCPRCGRQPCVCGKVNLAPRQQTAYVQRDRKRRAGKTVTVITGLQHTPTTFPGDRRQESEVRRQEPAL